MSYLGQNLNAISGYSGFSGLSGGAASLSGSSGYSGASGFSGFSGATGAGTQGVSGFSGFSGINGTQGASGFSGFSGGTGSNGASGFSGFSGATGSGSQGVSGFSGFSGASGFSGFSGSGLSAQPAGANGDIQYNNNGVLGGITPTGSGAVVKSVNPTLSGFTLSGPTISTFTPIASTTVDFSQPVNTIALTANTAILYSATPTAATRVTFRATADTSDRTMTIPSTWSVTRNGFITSLLVLANTTLITQLQYVTSPTTRYEIFGDPVATNGVSGSYVLDTSPSLTTPFIGAASATSVNGVILSGSGGTLSVVSGKTGTFKNTVNIIGTDGSSFNIGTGGTLGTGAYSPSAAAGGAGTPGGLDTQVQFNSGGVFGGLSALYVDKITGAITNVRDALGVSTLPAHTLINNANATLAAQQISPAIILQGTGYGTTLSAAQTVVARISMLPVQGGSAPSGNLQIQFSVNGAAYNTGVVIDSSSQIIGTLQSSSTAAITWTSRSKMQSPASGVIEFFNSNLNGFNRLNLGGSAGANASIQVSGTTVIIGTADGLQGDGVLQVSNQTRMLGGIRHAATTKSTNYSLSATIDYIVGVDTTAGTVTITLPASPTNGESYVVFKMVAGNTMTIGRNGNNIEGAASDLNATAANTSYMLTYVTGFGWKLL